MPAAALRRLRVRLRSRLLAVGTAATLAIGVLAALPERAQAADPLPIAKIQGTTDTSPYVGQLVSTRPSVVTAVYPDDFRGFIIQTPGSGGPFKNLSAGSDAIFVYLGNTAPTVKVGDRVTVTGTVSEYRSGDNDSRTLTQIGGAVTITPVAERLRAPRPVTGWSWVATAAQRESLESMLWFGRETYVVADSFDLRRFGQLTLSAGALALQPTEVGAPGSIRADWQSRRNAAARVIIDDGNNRGFQVTATLPGRQVPYLTAERDVTVGDRLRLDEPVVVDWRNNTWKFNPTRSVVAGDEPASIRSMPADPVPSVGGAFSVASFNVLNYFTTLADGRPGCTGSSLDSEGSFNLAAGNTCDVRGAYDADDLLRQQTKITTAINRLDASVVGLMEIENSVKLGEQPDEALATLVDALNAAAGRPGKWRYAASSDQLQPVADQDVITNAFIYQPAKVRLGQVWALGSAAGADGPFANARTPLAASFTPAGGGRPMVVVVNHFKSKSSSADAVGDNADTGQGAFNGDRVRQARAVRDWVPTVAAAAGTDDVAVIGDLNSYSQEDPIRLLREAGFAGAGPADEYSYVFAGLSGSLDHVLLSPSARQRMTRGDIWNINAGEVNLLEYSAYKTTAVDYYTPDVRRASDHDPVIAGFRRAAR
jgi:predicted extracellular nuclease